MADSIEGYAREHPAAAGTLQRRRQRLAALVVDAADASGEQRLDDPDARLELELALRARRLAG